MKYAFKVTRYVQSGKVVVDKNVYPVPDSAKSYVRVFRNAGRTSSVEVLHVYADRREACAARTWEAAASHYHKFTQKHLAELIRADIARAADLGINQELLNRWLGRGQNYYSQAGRTESTEPRKTAKLHIFLGLLEGLISRANANLNDDMRPYDRDGLAPDADPFK